MWDKADKVWMWGWYQRKASVGIHMKNRHEERETMKPNE